jgi:hypothetical protein
MLPLHRQRNGGGRWRTAASLTFLALLLVQLGGTSAAFGQNKPAEHFDSGVSKHFLPSSKKSYAMRKATKAEKPLLVILTRQGCGACQNLKQSVNFGGEFAALLAKGDFLVVHAENQQAAEWQEPGQGYAPQTYFFAPGEDKPLPILGTSEGSPHFLSAPSRGG